MEVKSRGSGGRRQEEPPWLSFSDALTGMLFVFIITTFWAYFQLSSEKNKYEEERKNLTDADEIVNKLIGTVEEPGALTKCLQEDEGSIQKAFPDQAANSISLYLPPRGFGSGIGSGQPVAWFESCQAKLGSSQLLAVGRIRACIDKHLESVWSEISDPDESRADGVAKTTFDVIVTFEGHTDALAADGCGSFSSNWELSGARAAAVVRAFFCDGVECPGNESPLVERMESGIGDDRLRVIASGAAGERPAWAALCQAVRDDTSSRIADRNVCDVLDRLSQGAAGPDEAVSALRVSLSDQRRYAKCVNVLPALSGSEPLPKLLRQWANSCPINLNWEQQKQRLDQLKRVDLRLELRPHLKTGPTVRIQP